MKAAELVVRCLENEGVRYIFGLPGEEALGLLEALQHSSIQMVGTRHEQGAAFMADVYGRLSGRAGVCLSTLGPGATNLLTGVADANMDRAPLVAIASQTSTMQRHKEYHQAIDLLAVFDPVTKWNQALTKAAIIPEAIRKAFKVAQTEKPGAVLLELPEDVAAEALDERQVSAPLEVQQPVTPDPLPAQVERGRKTLAAARRPVVLAGNGVVRGRAHEAVRRFAERLQIPVVQTFMAKGVVSDTSPLSLFTIGMQARDYAGRVMEEADCVIAVGYDFVEYAPARWNPSSDKHIIHVDVSPAEVDEHYIVDVGILGNVAHTLDRLAEGGTPLARGWAERARRQVWEGFQAEWALPRGWPLKPQHVLQDLRAVLAPDDLVVCDVGAHKIWMARMFPCEHPNTCVISNGFAAMGIAVPGSVAAKLLHPERQVVAVTGDGGFLMNSQELETAIRLGLALVVLVLRDERYGLVQWKRARRPGARGGGPPGGPGTDFRNPDLVAYAKSFGAAGYRVNDPSELQPILHQALGCGKVAVIDCPVDYEENLRLSERLEALP